MTGTKPPDGQDLATVADMSIETNSTTVGPETVDRVEQSCTEALERNYGDSASITVADVTGGGTGGDENQMVSAVFRAAYEHGLPIGSIEVRMRRGSNGSADLWIIGENE